jgi:hypothetical protein
MVPLKGDVFGRKGILCQPIEHTSGIRTSVNAVSKRYGQPVGYWACPEVALNLQHHISKQV